MEFEAKLIRHRNKSRIAVWYDNKPELIARFRKLDNARWSSTLQVWHIPDNPVNRDKFGLGADKGKGVPYLDKIEQIEYFKTYLKTKRHSANTVKTYSEALQKFLFYYNGKNIKDIDNQDVVAFYNDYILENKLSISYQNQVQPRWIKKIKIMYYYVYVLLSEKDNQFYTGYTADLKRRLNEHQSAKVYSTKNRLPLQLIYFEGCLNQQDATIFLTLPKVSANLRKHIIYDMFTQN